MSNLRHRNLTQYLLLHKACQQTYLVMATKPFKITATHTLCSYAPRLGCAFRNASSRQNVIAEIMYQVGSVAFFSLKVPDKSDRQVVCQAKGLQNKA